MEVGFQNSEVLDLISFEAFIEYKKSSCDHFCYLL